MCKIRRSCSTVSVINQCDKINVKRGDCFHPFSYIRLFFCAEYFKNSSAVSLVPRIPSTTILDNF